MSAPLPQDGRRRSPDRLSGRAPAETRSTRDEAHRAFEQELGRHRVRVPEWGAQARSGRRVRGAPVLPRHGSGQDRAHAGGSTFRIPATGSTRATAARGIPAAPDPRPGYVPRRQRYRDRSTGVAILAQLAQNIVQRRNGTTGRYSARSERRWRDPAPPHSIRQQGITRTSTSPGGRRHELGNDPIAVGYQDGFAGCRCPDILTELVLQVLDTHDAHERKVATRSYHFNPLPRHFPNLTC